MPREKMLWGGGENLAFIGADLNRGKEPRYSLSGSAKIKVMR
jgi:hypothetical protein